MDAAKLKEKLIAIFRGELEEHLRVLESGLVNLDSESESENRQELLNELFRAMHSIKGAAATVQAGEIQKLAHSAENSLAEAKEDDAIAVPEFVESLLEKVDQLRVLGSNLQPDSEQPSGKIRISASVPDNNSRNADIVQGGETQLQAKTPQPIKTKMADEYVSVAASRLERMMADTAELNGFLRSLGRLGPRLTQFINSVKAIGTEWKDSEDWQRLVEYSADLNAEVRKMQQVSDRLDDEIMNAQMQRFNDVVDWLPRTLHDLARDSGKQVTLQVDGGEIEISRAVAQVLRNPLRHLMRNAVDHGIESESERRKAGKSGEGAITISLSSSGGRLLLDFRDDGRGLDLENIKKAAVASGLDVPSDGEMMRNLVFEAGLSTRAEVSSVSGRGVGLDAARANLAEHGGNIEIVQTDQSGTTFRLSLPMHTHRISALQFIAAGVEYAMDVTAVESIERIAIEKLYSAANQLFIKTADRPLPVAELSSLFPLNSEASQERNVWCFVLVLQLGDSRCGIIVDSVASVVEILIKSLPSRAGSLAHLQGCFVTSEGRTGYVLNPADILRRTAMHRTAPADFQEPVAEVRKRLLIVDDTLTTRALVQTILETAGYDVIAASDGEQAWELLGKQQVELVVSDLEMPRLNGLDLTKRIRASERFRNLPVILLTGRGEREERLKGMEAGADAYLVKSGFDQSVLLKKIKDLI